MKSIHGKLLAVIAALAILASFLMAGTAMADPQGKITVADPGNSNYAVYKIFDATVDANGKVAYTLPADSEWASVLMNSDGSSKVEGLEFISDGNDPVEDYTVKKLNSFRASEFADVLKANVGQKTPAGTFVDASAAGLEDGYYLVVSSNPNTGELQDAASLATIVNGEEVVIQNKNDMPFDKTADGEKETSVEFGQVINFQIKGKVPVADADDTSYTYMVNDVIDDGITLNKDVVVTIGGTRVTMEEIFDETALLTGNQIRYESNGFSLSLDLLERAKSQYAQGSEILISYTGTVNEDAAGVVTENNANLRYGNDPQDLIVKDSQTRHYVSKIVIDKFESGAPEQKLSGASFVLVNSDGEYYAETNDGIAWKADQDDATVIVTDENGFGQFIGLPDGTYQLVEVEAPVDYVMLDAPVTVVVDGSNALSVGLTESQIGVILVKTVNISNVPGTTMPSTGGVGTIVFYVIAAGVLVGVGCALMRRRSNGLSK